MPEGSFICAMFALVLTAALGVVVYVLRLARKYRMVEKSMLCFYEGTIHKVMDIIYDHNDWFLRKVRLHTDSYPYVVDVLISDVKVIY